MEKNFGPKRRYNDNALRKGLPMPNTVDKARLAKSNQKHSLSLLALFHIISPMINTYQYNTHSSFIKLLCFYNLMSRRSPWTHTLCTSEGSPRAHHLAATTACHSQVFIAFYKGEITHKAMTCADIC